MKRRQLISAREAVPAKSQHKKPCSDCPWARTALNGWLGEMSPEEWIEAAHGEATVECHSLTGVQCAGIAIYRANNFKCPRDPAILRLPRDTKLVFEKRDEFIAHHRKAPTKMSAADPTEEQFESLQEIINDVEGDTKNVTRQQYREFLEQVIGECQMRLEVIAADDAADEARGSSAKPRTR